MPQEPQWGNLRRRLTVPFSEVRLKAMDDYVLSKAKELQQRIKKEQDNQVDITVGSIFVVNKCVKFSKN